MFEPAMPRRATPPVTSTNTHIIERVSSMNSIDLDYLFNLFLGFYPSIESWQSKSYKQFNSTF
jgi:hypothetical protein